MPKTAIDRSISALAALCLLSILPMRLLANPDHDDTSTTTPIKNVVVIFQENVSFDHYFGTYPFAKNPANEPAFHAKEDTPRVNNLISAGLLTNNPNLANPIRIDRSNPNTCDQDHNYNAEQAAFHGGLMDMFVQQTGCTDRVLGASSVMDYFDGNTVTAVWNYAQHFAMSDNHFGTTFGPSTPGALNVVSANTFEGTVTNGLSGKGFIANGGSVGAVIAMLYVDHEVIDFSSVVRFIEDNWNLGRIGGGSNDANAGKLNAMFDFDDGPRGGKLFLDPLTGQVVDRDDQ